MSHAILLKSIGCRTNQEEMATLAGRLVSVGNTIVESLDSADIVIVNTCLVTALTEAKTRRIISTIAKKRPQAKICITGCLAQHSPLDIKHRLGVWWVVGNTQKHLIPEIVDKEDGGVFHDDMVGKKTDKLILTEQINPPNSSMRTRFSIKIQEGCDFSCAYCIVPLVRGSSVCADPIEIETMCKNVIAAGYKEIVFTGTHIDQYKHTSCTSLPELARRIASLDGDFRVRLSSLDPRDLTQEFLELIGSHEKICRHCHISMQSLSATVLSAMNRPLSDLAAFVKKIKAFRLQYPDVGVGGDFIVGFPGETEEMFQETLENISVIGFTYGHVFRYSKRPGTFAASLVETVSEKEKTRRSELMRELLFAQRHNFIELMRAKRHTMLVETEHPASGLTSNYLRVVVPGLKAAKNSWLTVHLDGEDDAGGHCIAHAV
jgi:threonylcarbamoyladenosine tRNA methylthiotransferase MtaB